MWGVGKEEEEKAEVHMEVVSQNQELQTLISSHLLMRLNENLHIIFFPPNFSEVGHLKLSVKLRFQHRRNSLAALYRHI